MRKAELMKLPVLNPAKDVVETARNDKPTITKYQYTDYAREEYKYDHYMQAKQFGKILKVAIFTRDDILRGIPGNEIFLSKEENKFLTYNHVSESWRVAKIDNLNYGNYHPKERYYARGTEKAITDYLDNGKMRGYEAVYKFQNDIRQEDLNRQHRKITDKIDSMMELVPEIPKDFERWAENTAMLESRYIYYEYSRNVKEGWCTHCKKMVPIDSPKHNKEGICKCCRSHITFKSIKKAAVVTDFEQATLIQKTKEGYIRRYFEMGKRYADFKNPEFRISEVVRTFLNNDMRQQETYEWAEFKSTKVMRWCDQYQNKQSYYNGSYHIVKDSVLYTRNIKSTLKETEFKYSAIEIYAKHIRRFQPLEYIEKYRNDKRLEYMVKMGLYRIAKAHLRGWGTVLEQYATKPHKMLKIRKDQVRMIMEMNASEDELRVLQKANEAGVKITKEQIRWIAEHMGRSDLIKYMRFSTVHKMVRYIEGQKTEKKITDIASDYYDYLENSEKLGYDLHNPFILYPKDLNAAHDAAADEAVKRKEEIEEKGFVEIIEELKKYEMEDKEFLIKAPEHPRQIRDEGANLHHCVGTYIDRVLEKKTVILFIREKGKPDASFYTMEVKEGRVIQVRGKNNQAMTKEVEKLVEKFKKLKLETEERKAG